MPTAGGRDGFTTITPYLMHTDFAGLLAFVEQAFGAEEPRINSTLFDA